MPTTPFGPVRVDRAAGLSAERRLYLVLGDGTALRYTVAVGRPGKQWQGKAQVNGKYVQPAWTPRQCGSKAPGERRAAREALHWAIVAETRRDSGHSPDRWPIRRRLGSSGAKGS